MKSQKPCNRYALCDSPFYKLKGIGQLERLIGITIASIPTLTADSNYAVWWTSDQKRQIQAPIGKLASVHKRIAQLFSRIVVPEYVYSRKGRSHIDNAALHRGAHPLIKTDICKFYPSTSREKVVRLFAADFQCTTDIAHYLADVCCYQKHMLPTGSPLSGYIAFFAARPMFDAIQNLTLQKNATLSVFVDDITVSGALANRELLIEIRKIIRQYGYRTKGGKSRVYAAQRPKPVTGTIVAGDHLKLPNKQHLKIRDTREAIAIASQQDRPHLEASLKGRLMAADQVLCYSDDVEIIQQK